MKEFTLNSANKYKDGSPMMEDLPVQLVRILKRVECLENKFRTLDETQDELIEEYDAVLKTHGDTLEQHKERITNNEGDTDAISYDVENLQTKVAAIEQRIDKLTEDYDTALAKYASKFKGKINAHEDMLDEHLDRICELEHMYDSVLDDICAMRDRLCKITDLLVGQDEFSHIFSNFCGNCVHAEMEDGLCTCALSGEALDPDYASCSRFDPSFTHVGDRPDWMEKIRKDLTTPAEPTEGCKDCKCAVDGMCVKHNCSLGAICATPECYEPTPF